MGKVQPVTVEEAKKAALEVLLHNVRGPFHSLPRTAGWGYPEPYTRDLMISTLGILVSGNERLIRSLRRVLDTLARNQSRLGHIPSLVHDPTDRGASDTTPLFLIALALFRNFTGEQNFLEEAAQKALTWMEYQSPSDHIMVTQQPTSDWRDEQWVWGYGLYVNTLLYILLRLYHMDDRASSMHKMMHRFDLVGKRKRRRSHTPLAVPYKPHYSLCVYKMHRSDRFDLLGNSLAILSGIALPSRADNLISWVETNCRALREKGKLALDLPPCLFPYVQPGEEDWRPRYEKYGIPGEYHNGGVWPFICSFYVAAAVAMRRLRLAKKRFLALTQLVRIAKDTTLAFGFNEWFKAQDGTPGGEDWQTWSAAMYLYAAACIEQGETPFFADVRKSSSHDKEEK